MGATIFIGDELTAAGFRLTGIETMTPSPEAAHRTLTEARQRAELVIITAGLANHIPPSELQAALLAERPIIAVISDILSHMRAPDLARRLRGILGIDV